MEICGINICNCTGAVGHSDQCLRLAWRAARRVERCRGKHAKATTTLTRALEVGKMSPMLRKAIEATIRALKRDNLSLAYQITVCKSFIIGIIDPKNIDQAFQEDCDYNEEALGDSLYSILDGIHFKLAMALKEMPSGMMVLSAKGFTEMKSRGSHPIVRRILLEREECQKKYGPKNKE